MMERIGLQIGEEWGENQYIIFQDVPTWVIPLQWLVPCLFVAALIGAWARHGKGARLGERAKKFLYVNFSRVS